MIGFHLVPPNEYPDGLAEELGRFDPDLELVRLTPKFEFPFSAKLSQDWYIFPRPFGLRLPPNAYIGNKNIKEK